MAKKAKYGVSVRLLDLTFLSKGLSATSARTRHLLTADFPWPRLGIERKGGSQLVEADGAVVAYGAADWPRAILGKETVQGGGALVLTLTTPLSDAKLSKLLASLAKTAIGLGADAAASALTFPASRFFGTAADWLESFVGSSTDAPVLGEATLVFDDALLSSGGERTVSFLATRDIVRVRSVASGRSSAPKVIVRKGDPVATATLVFENID